MAAGRVGMEIAGVDRAQARDLLRENEGSVDRDLERVGHWLGVRGALADRKLTRRMTRPLRTLMVCPQFRPLVGGYERAAERLSHGLIRNGHTVHVVTERRDSSWPSREVDGGLVIHRIPVSMSRGQHSITSVLSYFWFLLRHARTYDVIHVHQYHWASAVAIAVGKLYGVPVVLKLTNTGQYGIDACLSADRFLAMTKELHRRTEAIVATSDRAAIEVKEFGVPTERVHRISNPLDTDRFSPASPEQRVEARSQIGVGPEFLAVTVGRVSSEKNHCMLVDAWTEFGPAEGEAMLHILGDGPMMDELRAKVDASPARSTIRLLGKIEDPLPWYRAADVFVLSSDVEGLSNSLMEALGAGLPMLSTRVSGAEDIAAAAEVGIMVEPGDAAAVARGLVTLSGDADARRRFGAAARTYACNHFAVDAVVEKTERMYARLLSESSDSEFSVFAKTRMKSLECRLKELLRV